MTKFCIAPEVEAIAEDLIPKHHRHLVGWRIEYLFRDKATTKNGVTILGTARIVKGRASFLARSNSVQISGETGEIITLTADIDKPTEPAPFFVIEIALDTWGDDDEAGQRWGLTDKQRIALVDHELCHCEIDDDDKPWMRPHSIEEFTVVIQRHGLWKPDVQQYADATKGARPLPFGRDD